jgi:hypothetical protein
LNGGTHEVLRGALALCVGLLRSIFGGALFEAIFYLTVSLSQWFVKV